MASRDDPDDEPLPSLTVGPVLGAKGRAEVWRWVRFRASHGTDDGYWGWGWILLPWVLPPGCFVSLKHDGEVEA